MENLHAHQGRLYRIPLVKNIIFYKGKISMQQGQAVILIARFPDPNYGIKIVNFYNKLSSPIVSSPRVPHHITWRFIFHPRLSIPRKPLPYQNEGDLIWISKNKANNNALGQTPTSLHKSAKSTLGFPKGHHCEIPIMPM